MPASQRRRAFAAITVIVFVDALGFALVLPFLPLYARRSFGASSLTVGAIVATFAFFQLFAAPFIGWFSDRRGRRPALLITLLGSSLGFLVLAAAQWVSDLLATHGAAFASAAGIAMLFLGRAINGISGGNLPVAQAYLTDITAPEERAHALGTVTTAFALALGIGPLIAGYLAGGDSFTLPALLGAAASLVAAAFCYFALPESRGQASVGTVRTSPDWSAFVAGVRQRLAEIAGVRGVPGTRVLLVQWFLFILCFAMTAPMFALIAGENFHLGTRDIGHLLALMAVLAIGWQAFVMKPLSSRLSDRQLAALGLASFLFCFVLVFGYDAVAHRAPGLALLGVVGLFGVGWACARPAITSALTKSVPDNESGKILGIAQSVDSSATIIGPLLTGALLQAFSLSAVGIVAALASALAIVVGGIDAIRRRI
jgi:MFS transporter, DHA1 family, tetracycline resistance protein